MPRQFRYSRYFAVCNAFPNPLAVLVDNCQSPFLMFRLKPQESCFDVLEKAHSCRKAHSCLWMMPRAAVESIRNRQSQEFQESLEV